MRYIVLLRGINIAGKNKIKMTDLKSLIESEGFINVTTYIQSGNIILDSKSGSTENISNKIKKILFSSLGFTISVITVTPEYLETIISSCPFKEDELNQTYAVFLSGSSVPLLKDECEKYAISGEKYFYYNKCIYLYCPGGYGKTKLNNNFFEKKLNLNTTTRNWRTVTKLYQLSTS